MTRQSYVSPRVSRRRPPTTHHAHPAPPPPTAKPPAKETPTRAEERKHHPSPFTRRRQLQRRARRVGGGGGRLSTAGAARLGGRLPPAPHLLRLRPPRAWGNRWISSRRRAAGLGYTDAPPPTPEPSTPADNERSDPTFNIDHERRRTHVIKQRASSASVCSLVKTCLKHRLHVT